MCIYNPQQKYLFNLLLEIPCKGDMCQSPSVQALRSSASQKPEMSRSDGAEGGLDDFFQGPRAQTEGNQQVCRSLYPSRAPS